MATCLATRLPARSYIQFVATAKRKKQKEKREKEAENLALKLPLRLQNGCLALMATSAPAGGNKQRTCSITRTTTVAAEQQDGHVRFAVCLPLAKMDGQIFSGRSGQLQQQLSAEGRETGDQRWSEAAGSCQVETYATLQNYQCGNQFHQFSLFPIGRNRNIFVIRLELRNICGLKVKENFDKVFIYKL